MGVIIQKKDGGFSTPPLISPARNIVMKRCMPSRAVLHRLPSASTPDAGMGDVRKAGYVPESVPLEHHMFGRCWVKTANRSKPVLAVR